MTSTKKIANAKKRINELERLIKCWDASEEKNINKIDFEFNLENKESVIDSASTTRSSITELKKELMSFSDLIKSTPTKLKNSSEVQNT